MEYSQHSQFFGMFGNYPSVNRWKDILTITNGKKYPDKYLESGPFPICGSAGVMYYGDRVMCDSDTIIIGRKGTINSPVYMKVPYWIVDTAFSISVDTRFLHPVYFYYWCKQFDFTKLNKQAVLPSLTKSDLEDILMPLPPPALQNEFADIVRQADKSKFDENNKIKNICHISMNPIPLRKCL